MGTWGHRRLLCIPQTQTCVGQLLARVGLLPACGGSGWPCLRGQGMLEQSWAWGAVFGAGMSLWRGAGRCTEAV